MTDNYYKRLSSIDVKPHLEQKQNLSYLSWAHALHFLLSEDPTSNWEVLEPQVLGDGTMMVWTQVTAFGITRKQWLPVMDHRNKAVANPDAFLLNKNIQRCLVKNIAAFGLGLSVFAGEDLPEDIKTKSEVEAETAEAYLNAINGALTAADLHSAFGAAWKSTTDTKRQAEFKTAYESRKAEITIKEAA